MANLKSSKKDVRRTARRTERNRSQLSRLQTAVREVKTAESRDKAQVALRVACSLLDRAAHSHLVHWRAAARQKARLSLSVNKKFPAAPK